MTKHETGCRRRAHLVSTFGHSSFEFDSSFEFRHSSFREAAMYKLHLIIKYLRKRRIAWWSLLAVTLCTTMVLVVISVMGGWLNMFEHSFQGLTGDIVVESQTLSGFPWY